MHPGHLRGTVCNAGHKMAGLNIYEEDLATRAGAG